MTWPVLHGGMLVSAEMVLLFTNASCWATYHATSFPLFLFHSRFRRQLHSIHRHRKTQPKAYPARARSFKEMPVHIRCEVFLKQVQDDPGMFAEFRFDSVMKNVKNGEESIATHDTIAKDDMMYDNAKRIFAVTHTMAAEKTDSFTFHMKLVEVDDEDDNDFCFEATHDISMDSPIVIQESWSGKAGDAGFFRIIHYWE